MTKEKTGVTLGNSMPGILSAAGFRERLTVLVLLQMIRRSRVTADIMGGQRS